jgi:hypothetical protein
VRAAIAACAGLAVLNLLAGLSGGLVRLGLTLPAAAAGVHGATMVCGTFGTLIALERAVALHRRVGLAMPLASGLAGVLAWGAQRPELAWLVWTAAAAGLLALLLYAGATRAWSTHLAVEAAGAACWGIGSACAAAGALDAAVTGWMGFLVLTIAGERRELTQLVRLGRGARALFTASVALALAAVGLAALAASGLAPVSPALVAATWWLGAAALAAWLLRWDIAPRQRRVPGWPGHTARALLAGYAWLLVAAALGLAGLVRPGGATTVALHALLLGFVFAMVIGHAPIVLAALAGIRPVYVAAAGWPVHVLGASLALRIAGAELGDARWLAAAGIGHALAIAGFAAAMVVAVRRAQPR